jgi:AcrR family transcriptional regulator
VTSRPQLRKAAWALFERDGFDETTVKAIALAGGISPRTFFRYYSSKSELVWADFDTEIHRLRLNLAAADPAASLADTIRRAVIDASSTPRMPERRQRLLLTLITREPSLISGSAAPFARWRQAVADYAASRLQVHATHMVPMMLGYGAFSAWIAACELWLRADAADPGKLAELVDRAFRVQAALRSQ